MMFFVYLMLGLGPPLPLENVDIPKRPSAKTSVVLIHGSVVPLTNCVTLAWDASTNTTVTSYKIYAGVNSGNYTNSVVVGNVLTATMCSLPVNVTNYFVVTALDGTSLESTYSNEVKYKVPTLPTTAEVSVVIESSTNLTKWTEEIINKTYFSNQPPSKFFRSGVSVRMVP